MKTRSPAYFAWRRFAANKGALVAGAAALPTFCTIHSTSSESP